MQIIGYQGSKVDAVRVLALRPLQFTPEIPNGADTVKIGKNYRYQILGQGVCDQQQAETAISLWNELPSSQQVHCHSPGFALQFIVGSEAALTAALCWGCNNIAVDGGSAAIGWRVFDGRSAAAIRLLRLCESVTGYTT